MKANPGKVRTTIATALKDAEKKPAAQAAAPRDDMPTIDPAKIEVPDFLTSPRSIEVFKRTMRDYGRQRIARGPDVIAYGRWAYYVDQWMITKEQLDEKGTMTYETSSRHGDMVRKHPTFQTMVELERLIVPLEDRLCINPSARQSYLRGLANLRPGALDAPAKEKENPPKQGKPPREEKVATNLNDPVGYLQRAGSDSKH